MNPKLIQKVNKMKEIDQKVRFDFPYKYLVLLIDTFNKIRIKRIIQKYGYPTSELLGEEGLKDFWLLIQHLDSEVELQKKCLENCHFAPTEYAYLYDRISVNSGKDQKYGTQFNKPIKNLYETNRNRVELGMLTVADWIEDFNASDEKGRKVYLFPKEDGSAEYGTNFHKKTCHFSYGIIPFYRKGKDIYICCVLNNKSGEWGLPKGTPEKEEN